MSRAVAAALGAALTVAVCPAARAGDIPLPDPYNEEEEITEQVGEGPAVMHFNSGVAYYNEERYDAALAEFSTSYDLKSNWAVLYNIGVCYYKLGRYSEARKELSTYLEKGGAWIPPQRKAYVTKLIKAIDDSMGSLIIDHDEAGVRVWVDGTHVMDTPIEDPIPLAAGLHSVSAYSEGYYPLELEVPVLTGEVSRVELDLEPTPMLEAWGAVHGPGWKHSTPGRLRVAAFSIWGVGGLALTGALVTASVDLARKSDSAPLELATKIQLFAAGGAAVTGLILWLAYRVGLKKSIARRLPWLTLAPAGENGAIIVVGTTWLPGPG